MCRTVQGLHMINISHDAPKNSMVEGQQSGCISNRGGRGQLFFYGLLLLWVGKKRACKEHANPSTKKEEEDEPCAIPTTKFQESYEGTSFPLLSLRRCDDLGWV